MFYKNITIIIPFRASFPERITNLKLTVNYLLKYFPCHILIYEAGDKSNQNDIWDKSWDKYVSYYFEYDKSKLFWKSKYINNAVNLINTEIFVIQDADIIIPFTQLQKSYNLMESKKSDFVLPFENNLMWIPISVITDLKAITIDGISKWNFEKISDNHKEYEIVGGCNFISKSCFCKIGGLNTNIRGWGFEDSEFYYRAKSLGLKITRIDGMIYHLNHPYDLRNDYVYHRNYERNKKIFEKVKTLSIKELAKYSQNISQKVKI